ncbi:antA/AntB antirepressor family protein [Campylobacter concisus]|uniref:antA/AntB antirepressor family protein n=1 Tax=Campylobacter concisus TaxID=199 RepID=UPI000CD90515|nr:antA/AntB antirepressor family protein [Campylobacter concisus]
MNEIITISQTMINNTEVNSVNARDLHEVLESDTKFSDWIKRRLDETDAILNADYIIVSQKRETITEYGKKASIITEYILTTDIAKEIAMMERNEKGKQVRRYFIEVEKAYKRDKVAVSQLDYMQIQLNYLKEQDRKIHELENKTDEIHKEQLKAKHNINRILNNDNYMTLIAYMNLNGISQKGYHIPSLGKKAKKMSDEQGAFMGAVIDPRYGRINTYSVEILRQIFNVA